MDEKIIKLMDKKYNQQSKEENLLNIKFQDEIKIQVLKQFELAGLSYKQLQKIQKQLPIIYPWNKRYQLLRNNYNRRFTYFPMGIIRCKNTKDVQESVLFVNKYNLEFSLRSGAHCYLAFSLSTGIIIDLFEMDQIEIVHNAESCKSETTIRNDKHVILGPGARLGVVIQHLSPYKLSLPVGSCPNTCIAGLSLGGGISPSLIRLSGLMCDHIIGAEMVLANGKIINVNKNHHSDLYFAIRGAGASNFGVVTKLIFNPCKFKGAIVFNIQYPFSTFRQVVTMWQNFAPFTDCRLSTELDVTPPQFTSNNELPVQFKGQFEGSMKELLFLIDDFIHLAQNSQTVYIKGVKTFAQAGQFWSLTAQTYFENNSIFWQNKLSSDALDVYATFLENAPSLGSSIEFNAMLGAVEDIKSNETAFPYRKSLFWVQHRGTTLNPQDLPAQQLWVNALYDAISPFAEKVANNIVPAYVNAPQANLQVDNKFLTAYYGTNVQRLIEIKNRYDPTNFFHFDQSIPTSVHGVLSNSNVQDQILSCVPNFCY